MVMALVGSAAALVWALSSDGVESGWELLLAGAAAPTLLKKVATAIAAKQDVVLKEDARYVVVDSLLREWIARKTY